MKKQFKKIIFALVILGFVFTVIANLMALPGGIIGLTKKNGETFGCGCHQLDPNDTTSVAIIGPSTVEALDTVTFQIKISRVGMVAAGTDIATQLGVLLLSPLDSGLRRDRQDTTSESNFELTHVHPRLDVNDTTTFTFRYVAPPTIGVVDTIFANGNAVNLDTLPKPGDYWNYAPNKLITIIPPVSVENNNNIVKDFYLVQNYPNPFNPSTKIRFNLYKASNVSISLFDMNGKEIAVLIGNKKYAQGESEITVDGNALGLTTGVYFYKLVANGVSDIKKMMLIK